MAVYLRAGVMLVVLVGLPAAWIYYGPLPEQAQQLVDRLVEQGKAAWSGQKTQYQQENITAPRFLAEAEPVRYDPHLEPASHKEPPQKFAPNALEEELEPHLAVLRKLGAANYTLEEWGEDGQLVRFKCTVAVGSHDDWTRHFEAVSASSLDAVRQVVGEVSSWQNAQGDGTLWR